MINVRVRTHNRPHVQPVLAQNLQNALDLIARIHHDRIACLRIAQNRAIALQHPHRNNFVNQFFAHSESIATLSVTGHFPTGGKSVRGIAGICSIPFARGPVKSKLNPGIPPAERTGVVISMCVTSSETIEGVIPTIAATACATPQPELRSVLTTLSLFQSHKRLAHKNPRTVCSRSISDKSQPLRRRSLRASHCPNRGWSSRSQLAGHPNTATCSS